MSKKPKLLTTLLSGEKRRHHVAAFITQEGDWNQHEPNTGFARMFIAMLILHVLIIGWIILSDSSTGKKAPQSPAAQAMLTKSKHEISGTPSASALALGKTDDGRYETYEVKSGDSLPMIVARFGVDRDELIALNQLDQNVQFSSGTVLRIPINKVAAPLQISAARAVPSLTAGPPPESSADEATATTAEADPPSPDLAVAASAFAALSTNSDTPTTLIPLPDVSASSTAPAAFTAVTSPADSPPAAISKSPDKKSDSVATSSARAKSAPKKTAVAAASPPRPVPPPSEMKKRPLTKADAPPAALSKSTTKAGSHTMAKGETLYGLSVKYGVSVDTIVKANSIKDPGKLRDGTKLVIPAK